MVYYYVYVREFNQVLEMRYLCTDKAGAHAFNSGSMIYPLAPSEVEGRVFEGTQEAQEHYPELF